MTRPVYVVPVVDVNWVNFSPLNPKRGYIADPPPLEQCAEEVDRCVDEFINLTNGRVIYSIHSGTYCRHAFYEDPFLDLYRHAQKAGAEASVHIHEEIAGKGTRHAEHDHVKSVIRDRHADLKTAGIKTTCYRGGHFAYMSYLTPLLEDEGLLVDFSCAPGFNEPLWDAVWPDAPYSAFYLNRDNHRVPPRNGQTSKVLEIPIGADGLGAEPINQFYTDESNIEDLKRVWKVVRDRGDAEDKPQFVHFLFHSSSMGIPKTLERLRYFVDHIGKNGAVFCNASEIKAHHDRLA